MLILIALFFVVISNFDLNKIFHIKSLTRNGGDSAALMAARWQGTTLNIIGNLNIMKAVVLSFNDTNTAESISEIQARLCFVGPMIGFLGSQQAAKLNRIYSNPVYDQIIHQHADTVRYIYPFQTSPDGQPLFPQPYEGCWEDYANMLDIIANEGIAAGPDNAQFYSDPPQDTHPLLMPDFYNAIRGQIWCWFFNNFPSLLESYTDYTSWPPLPSINNQEYINSEIFGLGLTKIQSSLSNFYNQAQMAGINTPPAIQTNITVSWYCYNPDTWSAWSVMTDPEYDFPINGKPMARYDYAGADAVIRIEATADRLTPGPKGSSQKNTITWTAAAKSFGFLNETNRPNDFGIVLPAFHAVALIPLDASSAPAAGSFNIGWREHIEKHLPGYDSNGQFIPGYITGGPGAPAMNNNCWYCQQLGFNLWESPAFRNIGTAWLNENSWRCIIPPSGGPGGSSGGTRRGH